MAIHGISWFYGLGIFSNSYEENHRCRINFRPKTRTEAHVIDTRAPRAHDEPHIRIPDPEAHGTSR